MNKPLVVCHDLKCQIIIKKIINHINHRQKQKKKHTAKAQHEKQRRAKDMQPRMHVNLAQTSARNIAHVGGDKRQNAGRKKAKHPAQKANQNRQIKEKFL